MPLLHPAGLQSAGAVSLQRGLHTDPLYRRAVVEREREGVGWRDARVVRKATDPFRHDRCGEVLLLTARVSR
jgi:hypothetical protein